MQKICDVQKNLFFKCNSHIQIKFCLKLDNIFLNRWKLDNMVFIRKIVDVGATLITRAATSSGAWAESARCIHDVLLELKNGIVHIPPL